MNDIPAIDLPRANLTENARTVLALRYLKKDEQGQPVEEPETMFWRVARVVAEVDREHGAIDAEIEGVALKFYDLMANGTFVPNSPTLMNAGRPLGQLSACFVLPVDDALSNGESGIYDTLRGMALVHQSGGGTGFSFSRIRPEGSIVRSTTGVASGPVSFMRLYDASTEVVKQGGTRRGANMGILRVDHPDIRTFITCKDDTSQITNFNISVAITDKFMRALTEHEDYDLICPRTGDVVGQESATEIFDKIVMGAWKTGEPGVFFIDRANEFNPVPELGQYEATNPCGEQPLLPYDVCNLGSINLGKFAYWKSSWPKDNFKCIDWVGLRRAVHLSVRFLDNVIDANRYPLPQIEELAKKIRRIGLGVMGWADMLVRLGVPYNSHDAVELAEAVMSFIADEAKEASEKLAHGRGVFPAWAESIWGPEEAARRPDGSRIRPMLPLRNCNLTTVAPTGTISIFADCSGGIEPLFAVAFMRNQAGVMMPDVNKDFVRAAKEEGWYSEELMERIADSGHIHHDEVPKDVQRVFVTAHDITPEWHVRMQAAFQKYTDSAISKTTNFPNDATPEDVRAIYEMAFSMGCKGVTVYRDGSRPMQVLSTGKTEQEPGSPVLPEVPVKRERPALLKGRTVKMECPLGDLYVTINEDEDGRPFEVFCTLGKAGGAATADAEAIGRLISLALRSGVPITAIRDQLRGISCDRAVGLGPNKVLSAPDAIGQALEQFLREEGAPSVDGPVGSDYLGSCPECGTGQLTFTEGCVKCYVCAFSKCG